LLHTSQVWGNTPVHCAAFVQLIGESAGCAQAPTLKSALNAIITASNLGLLVEAVIMVSLPWSLSAKG
jgi:hypothetical protein